MWWCQGKLQSLQVLVRVETSPEDIQGMYAAKGILTARGGMTSHAAVVARGMGRPCVSGSSEIDIDYEKKTFKTNNLEVNAIKKLKSKNCDMIIANDVSKQSIGFNTDINEVTIFYKDNKKEKLFAKNKSLISDEIIERVNNQLN